MPAPSEATDPVQPDAARPLYRERLWPSAWVFASAALVIPATLLVFLPIDTTAGTIVAIALFGSCIALLMIGSPVITITSGKLVAGRARLPIGYAGEASGHRGEHATLERGRHMDARAWLLIRGWVSPVVKITIDDPADPTPYWLISTRHPERLIAALDDAKRTVQA